MEDLESVAMKALETSLSRAKWRLKFASKRRLETDVLALCTGLRAVIMVDYGGKMPELQERLCKVLKSMQKESPIFRSLRVMVIEDMIYLIHVEGIAEFARSSLNSKRELLFVDLQQNPPKMVSQIEKKSVVMQLVSIQKLFCLFFPVDETNSGYLLCNRTDLASTDGTFATNELLQNSQSSEFIDLSHCMRDTQVTMPTLNGWLLGYPVVYLLSKEHVEDSIYNLSTKSLRLFKVLCSRRNSSSSKGYLEEELMSFSVPYDLSVEGSREPWAQVFEARMRENWENYKQVWGSFRMEVS